jgi:nitrogen regulatory protein PII
MNCSSPASARTSAFISRSRVANASDSRCSHCHTVRGFGQQFGERGQGAAEADTDATLGLPLSGRVVLLAKVRLDILVLGEDAQAMADAIAKHARTGAIGDGKIWVPSVDSVLRVRTGEHDRDAV